MAALPTTTNPTDMLAVPKILPRPKVTYDPKGFKDARKKYDDGDPRKLITMMQETETDSHAAGCLIGRRSGFKRSFSVLSYEDTDTDNERREWIQGVLERLQIRDLLEEIHTARMYLYSVVDFEWLVVNGLQVPVEFEAFDQKYFKYDQDRRLRIEFGSSLQEIPDTALVTDIRRKKLPIMIPVLRDWILKEYGVEAWAAFLENWGEPFIFAKYPPGADDGFKKQVEDGVNAIAASARGIGPDGTTIEIHESDKKTGDHEKFTARADKGIAITLLGHANAVEQSEGMQVGGNLAPFEVRFEIAQDDMFWLEPHINRLIRMIWDRNFADGRYPRFELDKSKPVDPDVQMRKLDMAHRHGLKLHPDEYRKLGLYVYDDQEPIQKPPSVSFEF